MLNAPLHYIRRHNGTRKHLKSWERERRERESGKSEELGKKEKRLLVIRGIMLTGKCMGGNFEERTKNI